MDALILIIIFILIGISLSVILYPLWQQTRRQADDQTEDDGLTLEEYELRYQAILASIRELMFDFEMGKVTDEDYETLMTEAKLQAAKVRQHLDALSSPSAADSLDPGLDAEIEDLVAQQRQKRGANRNLAQLPEVQAELALLTNVRPNGPAPAAQPCEGCGHLLQRDDKFCGRCGRPVSQAVTVAVESPACPQCGYAYEPDDAFCANCGTALTQGAKTQSYEDAKI
jgi:RNA polymerase subunit RPABC4/transcription elongation factor Spt4